MANQARTSVILALVLTLVAMSDGIVSFAQRGKPPLVAKQIVMPRVVILGQHAKVGLVAFNHVKHNGGDYNTDGPIQCTQCHHTAMPAADLRLIPPHKTVWPAGRDTTLTADLFAEDPKKAGVAACRDCHARAGSKPKLLRAIPSIKDPDTGVRTLVTNMVAFHTACDVCHFQIGFRSNDSKAPNETNCVSCHKR